MTASEQGSLEKEKKALERRLVELEKALLNERHRNAKLENRLSINAISGLPTHYCMDEYLYGLFDQANSDGSQLRFAILIIQLSNSYDMIKRTLKTSIAEWVLYQCAQRIQESLPEAAKLFHTRENEFLAIVPYTSAAELEETIKRIITHHNEPHIFSGFNLTVACKIGVASYPEHGRDKASLLHNADIALGAAIEQNRNFHYYREEFESNVLERMELQNSIIKAIEAPALKEIGAQFSIFFQPKVEIESVSAKNVKVGSIGAEALIRWNHPTRGMIPPDKFINIAEETGLIMPIGKWLLYQLADKMRKWRKAGLNDVQISVNLSARQFRSSESIETLERLIALEELKPESITIEITETSLFDDPKTALSIIERFKSLGFKISVDDFGTGYSSLSHIHRFPIDEIKIDKSFIANYPENKRDAAIVKSLAFIASSLGINLIAEGVERFEQLDSLCQLGATIQGFIFSHPLPEDEFLKWVKSVRYNDYRIKI
jgi:diguanylate cyclase (GGDEF)-like protein